MQPTAHQNISEYLQTSLSGKKTDVLGAKLQSTVKRALLTKVEFEAAASDHGNHLQSLKRKYIVLEDSPEDQSAENDNNSETKRRISSATIAESRAKQCSPQKGAKSGGGVQLASPRRQPKRSLYSKRQLVVGWGVNSGGGAIGGLRYFTGSGLVNLGNTCYLNSSLQALFHVPALVRHLLESKWHQHVDSSPSLSSPSPSPTSSGSQFASSSSSVENCVYCAVVRVLRRTQQQHGGPIKPFCVYSKLRQISRELCRGRQEDAHEFVRRLLETMQRCDLSAQSLQRLDTVTKETAPLAQLFGGYLRNQVTCLRCHHPSITYQHFQDIPVDIKQANTLYEGLVHYFGREKLGGCDYLCERCQIRVPATKKFNIEEAPLVLCIQLKRFGMNGGKLNKHVSFPSSLDVGRFMTSSVTGRAGDQTGANQVLYSLVSLVNHMGSSAGFGHYTAAARAANGQVYTFDDSSVRPSSLQTMLSTSAYLLFYEMTAKTKQKLYGTDLSDETSVRRSLSSANISANLSNTSSSQSAHKVNGLSDLTNGQCISPSVQQRSKSAGSKLVLTKSISSENVSSLSHDSTPLSDRSCGRGSGSISSANIAQQLKFSPQKGGSNHTMGVVKQVVGVVKPIVGVANQQVGVAKQTIGANKIGVVKSSASPSIVVKRPLAVSMVLGASRTKQSSDTTGVCRSLVPYDGSDDDKDDDDDSDRSVDNETKTQQLGSQAESNKISDTSANKLANNTLSSVNNSSSKPSDINRPKTNGETVSRVGIVQTTDVGRWSVTKQQLGEREDEGTVVSEPLASGDSCASSTASSTCSRSSSISTDSWRVSDVAKTSDDAALKRKQSHQTHDPIADQPTGSKNISSTNNTSQSATKYCHGVNGDDHGGGGDSGVVKSSSTNEKNNRQPVLSWMQRSWNHLTGHSSHKGTNSDAQTDPRPIQDHKHSDPKPIDRSKTNDRLSEQKSIQNQIRPSKQKDKDGSSGCGPNSNSDLSQRKRTWKLGKLNFGARSNSPLAKRPRVSDDVAACGNTPSTAQTTLSDPHRVSDSSKQQVGNSNRQSSDISQSENNSSSPPHPLPNVSSSLPNSSSDAIPISETSTSQSRLTEAAFAPMPAHTIGSGSGVSSSVNSGGSVSRRLVDKSALDSLLSNSQGPNTLGDSVLTWSGQPSTGSAGVRDDDCTKSELDLFNEELDIGKVKKCRGKRLQSDEPSAPGRNPFQRLQERRNQLKAEGKLEAGPEDRSGRRQENSPAPSKINHRRSTPGETEDHSERQRTSSKNSVRRDSTGNFTSPTANSSSRKKMRHQKQQQYEENEKQRKLDFWLQRSSP